MITRKRLEGSLADWHPHPREHNSLAPVVRDAGAPDEIANRFFETAPEMATPEPPIAVEASPLRDAIDSAVVRARRRYLMRYVAGAVSVAGVIGLAAIVRVTMARDARASSAPSRSPLALAASLPAAVPAEPALTPADPIVAANPQVALEPPAADPQVVADPGMAAATAADTSPPDSQAAAAARAARNDSQRALERGQVAASIEAGEQSVALDPTDADAWLILGAAYQRKGQYAAARRCFVTCVQQAQRGGRWECKALLQPERP